MRLDVLYKLYFKYTSSPILSDLVNLLRGICMSFEKIIAGIKINMYVRICTKRIILNIPKAFLNLFQNIYPLYCYNK